MVLNLIFRVLEGGSVKRERKDGLLMHASISAMFSLFPFFLLLSFFSILLLFVFLPILPFGFFLFFS